MHNEMEVFIEAAEQLQALKATLEEQQGSSVRLRGLTNTLEQVVALISKIPNGLSTVLTKAEAVEQRVNAATSKVEELRDGIPAIVERIERSDVGKSVDALSSDIAGSRDELKAFRESITQVDELIQNFRFANEAVFQELRDDSRNIIEAQAKFNSSIYALRSEILAKLDGIEKRTITNEELFQKNIGATAKAFEVIASLIKNSGERQHTELQSIQSKIDSTRTQEMAEMRAELKFIVDLISQQGAAIEVLSKKKGFSF